MQGEVLQLGARRKVRLLSVLGQGGFGVVYRGELIAVAGLVKPVAVKVLNRSAADIPELASRLRDEARVLALLRHRAIVGVDDLFEVDGRWALVMEYVQGVDLERLIQVGRLPLRPVCEILLEAASALRAAHEATHPATGEALHLVHRDIKPANLRITPGGEVKLLDFGIARAQFEEREATTRDMSFGSVGYMAPERWEGREEPASDVYALGIVAIEALSGRKLGQLSVEPRRHTAQVHTAIQALEDVPDGLRQLLSGMTDYFPDDRPTAAELVTGLRGVLGEIRGPWLAEWAPGAIAALPPEPEEELALADGNTPTFARGQPSEDHPPTGWNELGAPRRPPPRDAPTPAVEGVAPPPAPEARPGPARWLLPALVGTTVFFVVLVLGAAGIGGAAWFLSGPTATPESPVPAARAAAPEPTIEPKATAGSETVPEPTPAGASDTAIEPVAMVAPEPLPKPTPEPPPTVAPAPRPRPAPVPAPTADVAAPPPPEPAAPAALGEVVVDSAGVTAVVLRDGSGRTRYPGTLPTGTYRAEVAFSDGVTITVEGVEVRPSETTTLKCSALAQTCVIR